MFHSNVELKIIFLLTGCVAAFSQFPSPRIFLNVLSDKVTEGDSLKIACFAPNKYVEGWFFLFKNNESKALKSLPAAEAQHNVTFLLENVTTRDGGRYRCQYGLYNGSQLQKSEFSQVLEITVKGTAWFLPITLCVTGILLLVLILSAAVGTTAYFERRKKKRDILCQLYVHHFRGNQTNSRKPRCFNLLSYQPKTSIQYLPGKARFLHIQSIRMKS
ncbi:hypothetical protein E2320_016887 [Naja naja]|nr:hypothetical protein E2320_016887 [Naja naja]